MAGHRIDRISESIMRELAALLRTVKDPRVGEQMLSIVRVEVTNDLSYATVYVSSMGDKADTVGAVKGLRAAAGYLRRELGHALDLRHVPELRFVPDDSIAYSAELARKFNELHKERDGA